MSSEERLAPGDDRGGAARDAEERLAPGDDRDGAARDAEERLAPGDDRDGAARDAERRRPERQSGKRARDRETSAGGVVLRGEPGREQVAAIVPKRRAADGSLVLGLPKGHVDPGETALQAATREVREETGLVAESLGELGEVRYFYRRDGRTVGKSVVFFLFRFVSGKTSDHDHEIEEVRWLDLREAQRALTYNGEREMIERTLARLSATPDGRDG
jgi:8-oxo-dGTP pyrophosphatase MutT (NUDIX family)